MTLGAHKGPSTPPNEGGNDVRRADLPPLPEVRRRLAALTSPFQRATDAATPATDAPEVSGPADWRRGV